MALETLADIKEIGGYRIVRRKPAEMSWDEFDKLRERYPIHITDKNNMISFKIQDGPLREVGHNGCQVTTIIEAARIIIEGLNEKFPCDENKLTLQSLGAALHWQAERTKDRLRRGVEGLSEE